METAEFKIRKVRFADVPKIKQVETESVLSVWKSSDYLAQIDRDDTVFNLIETGGISAGFILARLITNNVDAPVNTAEIYNIAVALNFRKRGIGSILLKNLFEICRKKGIREIWLDVRESNRPALNFYKKHGFEKISLRKNYYSNPSENAIVMKCVL